MPNVKNIQIQKIVTIVSVLLLLAKLAAYFLTNSVAILTDALEGVVNIVAGFVGLYSLYVSAKPRDEDHPYGHGKIEFVSAGLEGSMIFIAGLSIIYQAIRHLMYPQPLERLDVGLALICLAGVANFILGTISLRIGRQNNSVALQSSGKHLLSDTYTTIGIVAGLLVVYATDIFWLDSVIAIVFALLILRTGYKIIRTSLAGIMDEWDKGLLVRLVDVLNSNRKANWIDLHNLRIIKYGNVLHVDCHMTVPWYLNIHEAHAEIDDLIGLVKQHFGDTIEFFIHTDGCLEFQCRICSKADCPVRQHPRERTVQWTIKNLSSNKKHTVESV